MVSFIYRMSPASQVFSVDTFLIRRFMPSLKSQNEIPRWPLLLIWLNWSLMFFSAAIAKLKISGLNWIFSNNLRNHIIFNQFWFHSRKTSWELGSTIVQFPILCQVAAASVLLLELSMPLIIFSKRFRHFAVLSCFIFQISSWFVLLVRFDASFIFYTFFVPWSQWIKYLKDDDDKLTSIKLSK